MTLRFLVLLLSIGLLGASVGASDSIEGLRSPQSFAGIADRAARSRALFEEMSRVIQHPRCLNCHPQTRSPLQGDEGRPHSPAVSMMAQTTALNCRTCHHDHNTDGFGGGIQSIPGEAAWMLAPEEMAWVGKTRGQICRQLKDRRMNGDRTLSALQKHFAEDHLVGWAWHPGTGRTPAPGTQAQFGALAAAWIASGAECPAG